ncbi:conserved protein of unknown function [Rhodovastum atsumiense]|uniref:DUF1656 domain-containing protein n=1 Tax=Rhodovastum atsumiense TaxID=504468 RepID=A0A5M6ISF4_9PROT|nr:DUF1656 domain-containing protein [Rhodovastum atsumiense]KAA5610405.1 DUF1656 domain-containing protein [Rhodovastum atsumiense]CAH2602910.1 conserved protein of unknown function [Rhodovastum atsumiense]
MIVDFNFGGVFIPGLVVLAFIALIATIATMRCFAATGISRLFAYRPLVEIATFLIICGLLMQYLPLIGRLS